MAELEQILQKLLVPDNTVIQQATAELREAFKNPAVVPALLHVLTNSENPQVRQYAAVLLRRRVVRQWTKLTPEIHQMLKQSLLQVLVQEPQPIVRHSAAQVVSVIAKHDLPANQWPELLQFLQEYVKSQDPAHREISTNFIFLLKSSSTENMTPEMTKKLQHLCMMGMLVLSSVTEAVGEQLRPHFPALFQLFSVTLDDQASNMVPVYTIQALTCLVECIGTDEIPLIRPLVPKVIGVINGLLSVDEDKACDAMEIFDELVEAEVSIVTPHLKALVEFCLQVAGNAQYSDNTRIKALSFISWLARIKPKAIIKNKLLPPILSVVFPIMAAVPSEEEFDEDDDELEDGAEASRPCAVASQVLDVLALHFPPETIIPPLMQFVQPSLASSNPFERKAALIALAVLAEGCADYIRTRHLQAALETVCRGLGDDNPVVQNAALLALGQFSEHLQPDISNYSSSVLPLLFSHLASSSGRTGEHQSSVTRTYYALETFCENLGPGILPYLPTLMERLLDALTNSQVRNIKELAISAIGATANAAKEAILPYFPKIVEILKVYLSNPSAAADGNLLQVQAVDTLGVLARTVGQENFLPLAEECIQLGMKLIEVDNDPDLRRCTYGLFASVSTVLKTGMGKYLQQIVPLMVNSLQSTEGIVTHYTSDNDPTFLLDEEIDDEDDEDDDEITGYSVENAYLEEKEDTCNALGEIAEQTSTEFIPFLDEVFKEVFKLVQFPHCGVRKGAVTAIGQFCCVLHRIFKETGAEDTAPLQVMLSVAVPILITTITKDKDRSVVMATLQALNEMLKSIKGGVLEGKNHTEGLVTSLRGLFLQQTACQDSDDDDVDDEQQQAEFDAMLIEYAGDILPSLAAVMGGPQFAPYFAGFLPFLLKKSRKTCQVPDKSFALGTMAEVILELGNATIPFVQHLYPVFLKALSDEDDEVRGNATYGIGLIAANGGEAILPNYPVIVESLFSLLKCKQPPNVVDNICSALCRMVMTNAVAVPMDQVFPVVIQCLPLKEDFEENPTVYSCIMELFSDQHPQVMQHLPQLLSVFAQVLPSPTLQQDIRSGLLNMSRRVHQQFPQDFEKVLASLPQEHASVLLAAVSPS